MASILYMSSGASQEERKGDRCIDPRGRVQGQKQRGGLQSYLTLVPSLLCSKTYCGYCKSVKQLLTQLGASYKVVELDKEGDGAAVQSALADWTGVRTVPNVFIGGNHIGGCDSVTEKHQAGQLIPLFRSAGAVDSK